MLFGTIQFDRLLRTFTGAHLLWWLLWIGLAVLTVGLLVLMRTRWGQSKPLNKCLALSLLAHLLMAGCATSLRIVENAGGFGGGGSVVHVGSIDVGGDNGDGDENHGTANTHGEGSASAQPWEKSDTEPVHAVEVATAPRSDAPAVEVPNHDGDAVETTSTSTPLAEVKPAIAESAPVQLASESERPAKPPVEPATAVTVAAPERADAAPIDVGAAVDLDRAQPAEVAMPELPRSPSIIDALTAGAVAPLPALAPPPIAATPDDVLGALVDITEHPARANETAGEAPAHAAIAPATNTAEAPPESLAAAPTGVGPAAIYSERSTGERGVFAARHGGGADTEAAVNAALKWLAAHQSADGRWEALRFGAGRENHVGGENRGGAGGKADTGVTGLALLAFLGAGHTHQSGDYQDNVRRGLDFLISKQARDGNLSGEAEVFAAMYCHGMATLALGEALGMTGDSGRLATPLRRAVNYTLAAQNPNTGGWRYKSWQVQKDQLGDTSQLGWQLMALKSADLAGLSMPQRTREGMIRFLRSVSLGTYQGLASYRPNEQPTRAMTAEALVCRQFLGIANDRRAIAEAERYLVEELPSAQKSNVYYWYYATLATYQAQGDAWEQWNTALKSTLINRQRTDGEWAGSWDTDDLWGGHGGRVFTTAMGALCLEVYYRFLPLYGQAVARKPTK